MSGDGQRWRCVFVRLCFPGCYAGKVWSLIRMVLTQHLCIMLHFSGAGSHCDDAGRMMLC
jgi:hypothetical protein